MADQFTTDPIADVVAAIRMVGPDALGNIFNTTETGAEFGAACAAKGENFPWAVIARTRRATVHRIAFGIHRREIGCTRETRDAMHAVGGIAEVAAVLGHTSEEGWMAAAKEQAEIDRQCENTHTADAWELLSTIPATGIVTLIGERIVNGQ